MKKKFSWARLRYWFDCLMSRGPITMTILLFAVMASIVVVIGVVAFFVADEGSLGYQLWMSLMHTLDAGTLANNATDNVPYVVMMSLATLCGLFITSILIGIIATGVESKLSELRKGNSVVQEQDHTVIIGFDHNVYTLLNELIEANSNHKNACIVVLGSQPKEEMEEAVASHIPDTRTTHIICRSGSLHESFSLKCCAVESCRSVIINLQDDAETVKSLLALSAYIKDKELAREDLRFVASVQESQYVEAAAIAGEGRAEIIHAKDAIARIIANTCRQHGLSQVLTELFNFGGDELYLESVPEMEGKTFRETVSAFSNAAVVGIFANGQVQLNPPMDTVIGKDDQLALLEEDDGAFCIRAPRPVDESLIRNHRTDSREAESHLIVLGSNDKLPVILAEYNQYVAPGTRVVIVDDDLDQSRIPECGNLEISVCTERVTRELLCGFVEDGANNILLLNDDSEEPERSDSQTLLRLILLRDIADKTGHRFSITTEMRSVDNQRLASQARVDDFVIGTNFASLLMAQISENYHIAPLITDLLDESGSELYMKPAADYVPLGVPVDAYVLTESAARRGEIYVGYRHVDENKLGVVVNPPKDETVVFVEGDQIVVIAED